MPLRASVSTRCMGVSAGSPKGLLGGTWRVPAPRLAAGGVREWGPQRVCVRVKPCACPCMSHVIILVCRRLVLG